MGGPVHLAAARRLRNEATGCELKLWRVLRTLRGSHGLHFRRQVPIGPYVADFGCHALRLVIEVDGRAHHEARDARRDAWFGTAGYRTVRFSNWQVMEDWDSVVRTLEAELGISRADVGGG